VKEGFFHFPFSRVGRAAAGGDAGERGAIPGIGFIPGEVFQAAGAAPLPPQQDSGWQPGSPFPFGAVRAGKAVHGVTHGW